MRLLELPRCAGALVCEARRHPDIDDDQVGIVLHDRTPQPMRIAQGGDDLVPAVLEQSAQSFAKQHLILGDHDPHGNSAVSVVPSPWSLSMRSIPPRAATRSERPLRPEPGMGAAPPTPSSATETTSLPFSRAPLRTILVAFACLTVWVSPSQA